MKQVFLTLAAIIAVTSFAQAEGYDDKTSCVVVYNKVDKTTPNLYIACDGELVMSHFIKLEKELENASQFKQDIFKAFREIVDTTKNKDCKSYETEQVFWGLCSKVQP